MALLWRRRCQACRRRPRQPSGRWRRRGSYSPARRRQWRRRLPCCAIVRRSWTPSASSPPQRAVRAAWPRRRRVWRRWTARRGASARRWPRRTCASRAPTNRRPSARRCVCGAPRAPAAPTAMPPRPPSLRRGEGSRPPRCLTFRPHIGSAWWGRAHGRTTTGCGGARTAAGRGGAAAATAPTTSSGRRRARSKRGVGLSTAQPGSSATPRATHPSPRPRGGRCAPASGFHHRKLTAG